eukprot:5447951-Pyramimonas_sp.AAC.2
METEGAGENIVHDGNNAVFVDVQRRGWTVFPLANWYPIPCLHQIVGMRPGCKLAQVEQVFRDHYLVKLRSRGC